MKTALAIAGILAALSLVSVTLATPKVMACSGTSTNPQGNVVGNPHVGDGDDANPVNSQGHTVGNPHDTDNGITNGNPHSGC